MNGLRKRIVKVSIVIVSLLIFPVVVYAATLEGENKIAAQDDTVVVDVTYGASGDSVAALNFDLNYDAARLTLDSITIGGAGSAASKQVSSNAASAGVEKVVVYGLNSTVLSNGVLVSATFTVKSAASDGSASVSFSNIVGASAAAQAVSITGTGSVITVDGSAPTVAITSPSEGDLLASGTVTVAGTVDDLAITEVDVNGATISVSSGNFSGTITLPEGDQTITVTATDAASNDGTDAIDVTIDLTAPVVAITAPNNGDIVSSGTVTVAGTVDDATITEVDVNGTTISVSSGSFSGSITLADGDHTITVTAQDGATNTGTDAIDISVDSAAPVVTISSPSDGTTQGTDSITVAGTVDDLSITEVDINGQTVSVSSGNFSASITLSEGDNTITVTAVDSASNSGTDSITVTFTAGDVNEDGVVTTVDVNLVRDQVIQALSATAPADVNNDGSVNVLDLQSVVNKI